MKHIVPVTLLAILACPSAAFAQSAEAPEAIAVTASASIVSQYRLRGISLSDEDIAVQGGVTISHASGFYAGSWASSLAGYGSLGGANVELDVFGGYATTLGRTTLDGGLIWYFFPGTDGNQYAEVYASVSHPIGPVNAKLGANYAFKRRSIGDADNLYVFGDLNLPIEGTPIALKGHLGYTDGKGSIFSGPRGHYFDYSFGADLVWKNLTLGISWVDTDIGGNEADAFYTVPGGKRGRDIVGGAILVSLTAAF